MVFGKDQSNKGKTYEELYGIERAKEIKRKAVETRMKNGSYKYTKETKRRMSLAKKGRKLSEKTKLKMSLIAKGKPKSKETIKKIIKTRKRLFKDGKLKSWNKGKTGVYSKETIKKMKEARAKQILPVKDTKIEVKIQDFLRLLGMEFFTHQYMKDIEHGYQCDIFVPSKNMVIECDGDYWHCYPQGKDLDHIRTRELIEKGFKVLRLWEHEINIMDINEFKDRLK